MDKMTNVLAVFIKHVYTTQKKVADKYSTIHSIINYAPRVFKVAQVVAL